MLTKVLKVLVVSGVLCALPTVSTGQQWSQFRGPEAGVAADDPALPESWSETENVVWSTNIPGHGWSSPPRRPVFAVRPGAGPIPTPWPPMDLASLD